MTPRIRRTRDSMLSSTESQRRHLAALDLIERGLQPDR